MLVLNLTKYNSVRLQEISVTEKISVVKRRLIIFGDYFCYSPKIFGE